MKFFLSQFSENFVVYDTLPNIGLYGNYTYYIVKKIGIKPCLVFKFPTFQMHNPYILRVMDQTHHNVKNSDI